MIRLLDKVSVHPVYAMALGIECARADDRDRSEASGSSRCQ